MLKNGVNYSTEELHVTIPEQELFDEATNEFITIKEQTIRLKHSLISVSKWEAKHKKQFLDGVHKRTRQEDLDYIRFMTITQNVDPSFYYCLTQEQLKMINDYISESMTGTFIRETKKGPSMRKPISSEEIYYWMTEYNIPPEYAKWHLSRLLMLIRVCSIKKNPDSKRRSKGENYNALNRARRKKHHTRG